MKWFTRVLTLIGIIAFIYAPFAFAEEAGTTAPPAPAAAPAAKAEPTDEEALEYSYGVVNSVSATQLVVTEYDFETDADVTVTYELNDKTELTVASASEIKVGDDVEIDYKLENGKKVAVWVGIESGEEGAGEALEGEEAGAPAAPAETETPAEAPAPAAASTPEPAK